MSESELGLALVGLVLAFVLGRWRRARIAKSILTEWKGTDSTPVTWQDLSHLVAELAPTLEGQPLVHSPALSPEISLADRGHVWSGPNGQRVYMN